MMKKTLAAIMAVGIMAAGIAGCSRPQAAPGQTQDTLAQTTQAQNTTTAVLSENTTAAKTEDMAKKLEGKITLYTSQPEADAQQLIDGFHKVCPDIEVEVFRSGTEEVVSKVLAEKEADSVLADVLLVADSVTFETLKEQDMMMAYESPELEGISEEFIDPEHMYTGTKVIATGIMYNTELVQEEIKGFSDLDSIALKDNIIMPSPLYSGAAAYNAGVITRTEGLGWETYEKLKENGVTVDKGNGAVQKAVVAGEKACGIIVDYMAVRSKKDGAPVEFVYPEEGSPAITEPIGILKSSKNPELAEAFVDFVLSEDGQKLAAEIGYTPVKSGVAAPEGLKSIDELKTISYDIETLYKDREADKTKFSQIFES